MARALSLCIRSFPATRLSFSSRFNDGKSLSAVFVCSGGLAGEICGGELAIRFCPEYIWGSGGESLARGVTAEVSSPAEGRRDILPSFRLIFLLELAMVLA